jgi:hypothetical protein
MMNAGNFNFCRYFCDCSGTGYAGNLCDEEIDECESSPCQHGASCVDHLKVIFFKMLTDYLSVILA